MLTSNSNNEQFKFVQSVYEPSVFNRSHTAEFEKNQQNQQTSSTSPRQIQNFDTLKNRSQQKTLRNSQNFSNSFGNDASFSNPFTQESVDVTDQEPIKSIPFINPDTVILNQFIEEFPQFLHTMTFWQNVINQVVLDEVNLSLNYQKKLISTNFYKNAFKQQSQFLNLVIKNPLEPAETDISQEQSTKQSQKKSNYSIVHLYKKPKNAKEKQIQKPNIREKSSSPSYQTSKIEISLLKDRNGTRGNSKTPLQNLNQQSFPKIHSCIKEETQLKYKVPQKYRSVSGHYSSEQLYKYLNQDYVEERMDNQKWLKSKSTIQMQNHASKRFYDLKVSQFSKQIKRSISQNQNDQPNFNSQIASSLMRYKKQKNLLGQKEQYPVKICESETVQRSLVSYKEN